MEYKFQFDELQKTALTAAISLWEKQDVKQEITEFFENNGDELDNDATGDEWKEFIQQQLEESDQNMSSPKLKSEWMHIAKNLGEKIFNWYLHVEINRGFPFAMEGELSNYSDKIHWTSHGTIDEVRIFQSYLSKHPHLNLIKMYSIACSYALEKHINDLWHKMSVDMKDYCDTEIEEYPNQHMLAYWKYRRDNNQADLLKYFNKVQQIRKEETNAYSFEYNLNHSPEENMLWVSVNDGFHIAVEYYWSKLTEEARNRCIRGCARLAAMRYSYYSSKQQISKNHKMEKYVDICVYLMNQMTVDQRKSFFTPASCEKDGDVINLEPDVTVQLRMMLSYAWPWQELFIPVIKDMIECLTNKVDMLNWCLRAITVKMYQDHELGYAVEHSKYQNMFQALWSCIPRSIKLHVVYGKIENIMTNLIEVWDLDNLKLLFNDPETADARDHLIESGKRGFLKLLINDRYDLLDQLIKEIFRFEEERKSFKQQINIWLDSPANEQHYTGETLFNHRRHGLENAALLAGGISDIGLCEYFIKSKRYDSVDKFLNWKFEIEEERRMCKNHFKNDKFIIEHLVEIWKSCGNKFDEASENSSRFLLFLLESEEEVTRFKRENIVNSDYGKLFINYFVERTMILMMENFLFGCSSSKEEVKQVKQKIGSNMGYFICNYYISTGSTEKAESFVRWAFIDQQAMHSFVKEFILSDNGIASCIGLLDRIHAPAIMEPCLDLKARSQKFSKFVDFWLVPLENIQTFKNILTSRVKLNDDLRKENYEMLMDLVEKLG